MVAEVMVTLQRLPRHVDLAEEGLSAILALAVRDENKILLGTAGACAGEWKFPVF